MQMRPDPPGNSPGLKPLRDVDSTERAQLIHALSWLAPALLILGAATTFAGGALLGLSPLQSLLAGLAVVVLGFAFFYLILLKGFIGGTASLIGSIYGGPSTPATRRPAYSHASALATRGAHDDALAVLEAEVFQDPGDPGPYLAAATICMEDIGDNKLAVEWYRRALGAERITPETGAYVCIRLAQLHESEGDTGRACVAYRRALERYPESRYSEMARSRLKELKSTQSRSRIRPSRLTSASREAAPGLLGCRSGGTGRLKSVTPCTDIWNSRHFEIATRESSPIFSRAATSRCSSCSRPRKRPSCDATGPPTMRPCMASRIPSGQPGS